jgi:UDP-GlcNAc3NAcA epimerase
MKKIVTVIGARPQFIKAAAVSRALAGRHGGQLREVLVHTGQHYDDNMSRVFFEELGIPEPAHNLGIAGGSHGEMTGRMLESVEKVLRAEQPDWLLVYGDTNSTLAGALAAVKLHVPVAHVEAGLRSFNMRMPEEVNRIVADRVSTLLFCPTTAAVANLRAEGRTEGVHHVGDVMYDVALHVRRKASADSAVLAALGLAPRAFVLATCHRAENTDHPGRLAQILEALAHVAKTTPVVLPLHPRTRKLTVDHGLAGRLAAIRVVEPLSYLDMAALEQAAAVIVTDSGGVQKEAFFYGVPCITMRDETEWVETVALGMNTLTGADAGAIASAFETARARACTPPGEQPYGDGHAAERILELML